MLRTLSLWFVIAAGLSTAACECVDCERAGPTIGHVRALAQNETGTPVPGVSVHLDNRIYTTEPQITGTDGAAVLLVSMAAEPTDTGTVTAVPPASYLTPPPQPIILHAGDTVEVTFTLQT